MAETPKNTETTTNETKADAPDAEAKTAAKPEKRAGGIKVLALLMGVAIVAFAIVVGGYEYFAQRDTDTAQTEDGAVRIGGPFTLVNHDGETVTDKDFLGKHMLLFFGFTYCPDICPTALSDVATALDMIGEEKAEDVIPVFISVDPVRDTPEHLKEYVSFFHPNTVGLTGTEEQIRAAAREYRAYYRIGEPESDDPLDYLVDHTAIIYVVGPDGNMLTHFSHGTTPEAMAERLGRLL